MKAIWNGVVVAESDDTVVVEGNHYFPESALQREFFTFSNHKTMCQARSRHGVWPRGFLERRDRCGLTAVPGYPCPHWTIMWISSGKPCMGRASD